MLTADELDAINLAAVQLESAANICENHFRGNKIYADSLRKNASELHTIWRREFQASLGEFHASFDGNE